MPPGTSSLLSKEALLTQVRKLNEKAHKQNEARTQAVEDSLQQLIEELAVCNENMVRLRHDKAGHEYQAAKARKAQLEREIANVKHQLDPVSEFERIDRIISETNARGEASAKQDAEKFSSMAKTVDDRLHKKTGWADHTKPFSLNTRELVDVITRTGQHHTLGESDPRLLAQAWTRFDHKPAVPWRKARPGEGLAHIAAEHRRLESLKKLEADQMEQSQAVKPALDLSFASTNADGLPQAEGRSTRAGQAGMAGGANSTRGTNRPRLTLSATGRTTLPEIPSHTVTVTQLTSAPVPTDLLGTMTKEQTRLPRHPAYLLDSQVHHRKRWSKLEKREYNHAFSVPPRERVPTKQELKAAAVAVIPDRNFYHPRAQGREEFYQTDKKPYPMFSWVPLDRDWLRLEDSRRAAELEAHFWESARAMSDEAGQGYEGEDAFEGGEAQTMGSQPAPLSMSLGPLDGTVGGHGLGAIPIQGEPSLPFQATQRYREKKEDLLAHMKPALLGAKLLDHVRSEEHAKLEALAVRVGTSRGTHGQWANQNSLAARASKGLL